MHFPYVYPCYCDSIYTNVPQTHSIHRIMFVVVANFRLRRPTPNILKRQLFSSQYFGTMCQKVYLFNFFMAPVTHSLSFSHTLTLTLYLPHQIYLLILCCLYLLVPFRLPPHIIFPLASECLFCLAVFI